jgi:hypothetical protein
LTWDGTIRRIGGMPPRPCHRAYLGRVYCLDAVIEKVLHFVELLREYRGALISAAATGKIDMRETATS